MGKPKYGFAVKAAVLAIIVLQYSMAIPTPALGAIAKAFPNVSPELVKQIAALPNLIMIAGALLCGQLDRFITKRQILGIGMACIFIGGITPAFLNNMTSILVMRGIFGFGYGIVFTLAISLISDLFEGKERDSVMGANIAVGAISGVVYQIIGGYLAAMHWRYAFLGYLITIPFIILILLKLPEPEKQPPLAAAGDAPRSRLTPYTWLISLFNVFAMIMLFSFITNMAIVISMERIGTPAQAGLVLTVFTLGAFLGGVVYPRTISLLMRFTFGAAVGLLGLALFILLFAKTFPVFFVAAVIFGLGFGLYNPVIFLKVTDSVHPSASTLAMSVFIALNGVGQFLSPIVLAFIGGVIGVSGVRAGWQIAAPCLLVACVAMLVVAAVGKKEAVSTVAADSLNK